MDNPLPGSDAMALAKRKARYGRRDWILWRDRGNPDLYHAAPWSAESVKAAMLARGTQGRWTTIDPKGTLYSNTWRMGVIQLRNARLI